MINKYTKALFFSLSLYHILALYSYHFDRPLIYTEQALNK